MAAIEAQCSDRPSDVTVKVASLLDDFHDRFFSGDDYAQVLDASRTVR